jgi:flagellar M-ring protein FliF
MDFLNKSYAQVSDLLKSLSPGARITSGLLLAVVIISVAYLFNHRMDTANSYLMGGKVVEASLLPAMEGAFAKAGLSDYELEGNRIRVPRHQRDKYMGALVDAGALPSTPLSELEDAAKSAGPLQSSKQRGEMLKIAKQKTLSSWISAMDGIERAVVLYDSDVTGFRRQKIITASVTVKPLGSAELGSKKVRAIRHLVASSIAGLKSESVTVINTTGEVVSGTGSGNGGSAMDNEYIALKKQYQKDWANSVKELLAGIPGVRVQANVELNADIKNHKTEVKVDPKGPVIRENSSERTFITTKETATGDVGVRGQSPNSARSVAASGGGSKTEEGDTQTKTDHVVGHTETETETIGLTPKRVTIAVAIPASYYERVWLRNNPPAEGEEPGKPDENAIKSLKTQIKTDITSQVNNLLPTVPRGDDPFPRVTVTTFQDLAGEKIPELGASDHAMAWVGQNWSTLGMTGVAMFSLLMLRSMVKSVPSPSGDESPASSGQAPVELAIANYDEPETNDEAPPALKLKRRDISGPNLRDELSDIVKEDPDAAASILKSWIANAS